MTVALDRENLRLILETISQGFESAETVVDETGEEKTIVHTRRPNKTIAMALWTEAMLGIRISDVVKLRLCDIVREKGRYHLNIVEQKTSKHRSFVVPAEVYATLEDYRKEQGIGEEDRLFPLQPRVIQKHLKLTREYLELKDISTHSFRKNAGAEIYEQSGHDIEIVRQFFQHSSVATTQRYLGVGREKVDAAILKREKIDF